MSVFVRLSFTGKSIGEILEVCKSMLKVMAKWSEHSSFVNLMSFMLGVRFLVWMITSGVESLLLGMMKVGGVSLLINSELSRKVSSCFFFLEFKFKSPIIIAYLYREAFTRILFSRFARG